MNTDTLVASSPLAWIAINKLVTENQVPVEFTKHRFMIDPLSDTADDIVGKKSAQVGWSVGEILRSIHSAQYEKRNIGYILPTKNVVDDFVKPKVNPLILKNPLIAEQVREESISLKKVGDRFIYFKGAFSQTAAISFSIDTLVLDEYDRMPDMSVVNTFDSRLQAAAHPKRRRFSNPSGIGFGVDRLYQESNQYHWFVRCAKCNHEWFIDYRPSDEKNHYVDKDNEIYACGKCTGALSDEDRRMGRWVAKYPTNPRHGYWFSQMMAPWVSAKRVIEQDKDSTIDFFYNFVLGKAYTPSDVLVTRDTIRRANAPGRPTLHDVVIGVDNGIIKHYVIGSPNGVFRYGKTESWEEIESLLLTYDAIMVIDANPYPTMPKKLAEKYPGKVFIHYYAQDRKGLGITRFGENENRGVVLSDRTKLLDVVAQDINEAKIIFTQPFQELEEFIYHCTNIYRTIVENAQGISQGKWITFEGKPDHYFHSLAYMRVALSKRVTGGMGEIIIPQEPQVSQKSYVDHFDIARSIKAAKREKEYEVE